MRIDIANPELRLLAFGQILEETGVQRGAVRDRFVRGEGHIRFPSRQFAEHFLNGRHPRGPADQQDAVDIQPLQSGRADRLSRGKGCAVQQVSRHAFELLPPNGDAVRIPVAVAQDMRAAAGRQRPFHVFAFAE